MYNLVIFTIQKMEVFRMSNEINSESNNKEVKKSLWQQYKEKNPQDRDARPLDLFNKDLRVSDEIAEERFNICKACPNLIPVTNQCSICKCFMSQKVKLSNASCPIGKWGKVENKV